MTKIWLCSIDIGKKNFAFYIEEIDKTSLMTLPNVHQTNRYNTDGSVTEQFSILLKKLYNNGKIILFKNTDLTVGCRNVYLDSECLHNMTDLLDEYVSYWDKCDAIVIEKQMSFGKKYNTMALKLGQHCWSYFSLRYGRFKEIVEFPAYYKTQILGAERLLSLLKSGKKRYKTMDKSSRKKWSVQKAQSILLERDDDKHLLILNSSKKRDDLADVICQLQSFKYLVYVDKSI